jgi:hypothetical protein
MPTTLPQPEADALLALPKHRASDDHHAYPMQGNLILPLVSADGREFFHLDISRGRIDLAKGKYQTRARQVVVLARIDSAGPPHRNPDDVEVPCPHLHIYREGHGDKWAVPLPSEHFSQHEDRRILLDEFFRYCVVTRPPFIDAGLFT